MAHVVLFGGHLRLFLSADIWGCSYPRTFDVVPDGYKDLIKGGLIYSKFTHLALQARKRRMQNKLIGFDKVFIVALKVGQQNKVILATRAVSVDYEYWNGNHGFNTGFFSL